MDSFKRMAAFGMALALLLVFTVGAGEYAGSRGVVIVDTAGTAIGSSALTAGGVVSTAGTGVAVACDTTPAAIDDTSTANTNGRLVECCNPSTNTVTVRIGGTSVGANAAGTEPGVCKAVTLGPSAVLKCYAASTTTIQCVEYI
jgi:hypothetical protein